MEPPQLENLERRAFRSFVDDGLLDIALGFVLFGLGIMFAFDINVPGTEFDIAAPFTSLLPYPLWRWAKRRWIEPRAGYVRLRPEHLARIKRRKATLVYLLMVLVFALVAIVVTAPTAAIHPYKPLLLGIVIALPVGLAKPVLGLRRWSLYAGLILVGAIGGTLGLWRPMAGLLLAGIAVAAIGSVVLAGFLRRHPIQASEVQSGV